MTPPVSLDAALPDRAAMSAAAAPASATAQAAGAVEAVLSRASSLAAEIDRKER